MAGNVKGSAPRRRGIISLATARRSYPQQLSRMQASVGRVGFGGQLMCWPPGRFPAGCPDQLDVPFAFKPFCFAEAGSRGLVSVLWLDASCVAIRPLEPLFEAIEERGYLIFRHPGKVVGTWASDEALSALGVPREQAMAIPEANAAAIGLKLDHPVAARFLRDWLHLARDGVAFRGTREQLLTWDDYTDVKENRSGRISADPRVRGHRHDQTVVGVLAHRLGIELTTEGMDSYSRDTRIRLVRPTTAIVHDRRCRGPAGRLALRVRRDKQLGRIAHLLTGSGGVGRRARGV
jgi:hypothetical protein